MYLTLDIGNSSAKLVLFKNDRIVYKRVFKELTVTQLKKVQREYQPSTAIIATVVKNSREIIHQLNSSLKLIQFNSASLPIKNKYRSPETLGNDRLAGAVAAASIYPGKNVLIIDAGTCIKYDFVNSKNEYIGGSISPGLHMRYQALHTFTGKLPLVEPGRVPFLTGKNTRESILSGVELGMQNEISGFISLYRKKAKNLKLIMTGGDSSRFVRKLNLPIFAAPDLVNIGLKEILKFHDSKE